MVKIPVMQIETGVPMPDNAGRSRYLLDELDVGQSVLVPIAKRSNVSSMATHIKRRTGKEFTTKKVDKNNVRVWRTK